MNIAFFPILRRYLGTVIIVKIGLNYYSEVDIIWALKYFNSCVVKNLWCPSDPTHSLRRKNPHVLWLCLHTDSWIQSHWENSYWQWTLLGGHSDWRGAPPAHPAFCVLIIHDVDGFCTDRYRLAIALASNDKTEDRSDRWGYGWEERKTSLSCPRLAIALGSRLSTTSKIKITDTAYEACSCPLL